MGSRFLPFAAIVSVVITLVVALPSNRPAYIDCVSSVECGTFECCSLGMGRFSIPTCKPLLDIGDTCSPRATTHSANLTYPDGSRVMVIDAFYNVCPCGPGLRCSEASSSCIQDISSRDPGDNFLQFD